MWEMRNSFRISIGNPEGRDHSEDQGVDGMIILKWIFSEIGFGGLNWIHLTQNRDRWRALVSTVINIRVP
jgi:hypothetical protein